MIKINPDIIKKCKKGDSAAQKLVFEKLYAPMYRVCMSYLGIQADAEDCLMRGMMKAFQKLDGFDYKGEHSFYSWLRTIMVNESLMEIRKRNYLMLVPEEYANDTSDSTDIMSTLAAEEIFDMILELPLGYRTVFNLYVIEGFAHAEIAEKLQITESTSRTQLAKARAVLQKMVLKTQLHYGTDAR